MTSAYNPSHNPERFAQWLDEVLEELFELGHTDKLTTKEVDWLHTTWNDYDLSPVEAAQSLINESPG